MNLLACVVAATSIAVAVLPLSSVANLEETIAPNNQKCQESDLDGEISCPRVPANAPTSPIVTNDSDACKDNTDGDYHCPHGMQFSFPQKSNSSVPTFAECGGQKSPLPVTLTA